MLGRPVIPDFGFTKGFVAENDGAEYVAKMVFAPKKIEPKGKLLMDPLVESSWKLKDYSSLTEESILLVGKFMGMLEITLVGFAPQVAGVGQMKLESLP